MAKVAYKCGKCNKTVTLKKEPATAPTCCGAPMTKVEQAKETGKDTKGGCCS
jgi:DNA-directed RNA polymerase subunit RPC12/RpoP